MIKAYHNRLGLVDLNVIRVDTAVNDYDERLFLDKGEQGDWVIKIKMPHGIEPYPVMGFQYELPDRNTVIQRLRESDSQREDIRGRILAHNKAMDAAIDHQTREAVGAGAEAAEYIVRKESGHSNKSYRKVTPKKKG